MPLRVVVHLLSNSREDEPHHIRNPSPIEHQLIVKAYALRTHIMRLIISCSMNLTTRGSFCLCHAVRYGNCQRISGATVSNH